MKIFIPFDLKDIGGTSSFVKKFKKGAEARGHEVFLDPVSDYDVLLIISRCSLKYLLDAKRRGKKIIHRLDGVYYWSVAGWKYFFYNFKPMLIHRIFADFTVYQSRYSRYCVEKFMGKRKDFKIIYNGIDLRHFFPEGKKMSGLWDNSSQKMFFTASRFRRYDQILPLLAAVKKYGEKYDSNYKFLIAGSFSGQVAGVPEKFSGPKTVFLGKVKNEDLPKYERASDVFLFSHLNPPCPNNIVEATACGLPICGVADGAMPEMILENENGLLVGTEGDAFWSERKIDSGRFADNMDRILKNRSAFARKSREIAENRFSIETMLDKYLEEMQ